MSTTQLDGDVIVRGNLSPKTFSAPAACIANNAITAAAGNYVDPSKLGQQRRPGHSQPNTTATTETRTILVVYGATGNVLDFRAGSIVACAGAATITVDLKKNGTSVLAAVITLNSSSVARVAQAATITTPALAAGDWLEVVITATAGGGTLGTGVFCQAVVQEDPQ